MHLILSGSKVHIALSTNVLFLYVHTHCVDLRVLHMSFHSRGEETSEMLLTNSLSAFKHRIAAGGIVDLLEITIEVM